MKHAIWSIKEIIDIIIGRQANEFDSNIAVSGDRGNGKTQIKGNKVLMSNCSWKNVEDIKIGDCIISPQFNGKFTYEKVINLHSRYEPDIYDIQEVSRKKKILYSCSWNHELPIFKRYSKRTSKDDSSPRIIKKYLTKITAEELSKKYVKASHYSSFTSPLFESDKVILLDIEPYTLGVFLGDGSFTNGLNITSNDLEIMEEVIKYYQPKKIFKQAKTTALSYRFSIFDKLSKQLIKLGLRYKKSNNKFIPEGFLRTSKDFRFKLLAGLIDTDGFISKANQITICTKSKKLATNIKDLIFSLGGYSLIRKIYKNCQSFKEKRLYYDVSVQFENPFLIPLQLKRKRERLRKRKVNPRHIAIESKKRIKGSMVYGFGITGDSKHYVTDNFMVTHNSTFILKTFYRLKNFNSWKHQVYNRDDVIRLLKFQQYGLCWDDEAINSGYKRNFQEKGQQELIKILTAYRDNFNVFASAIPNFFSLDKDLRDLYFIHIHIIERGIAVIHMPLQGRLYSQDRWDAKYNAKVESSWSKGIHKDPNFRPPYHKLTTFRGYLFFGDVTDKQKELYKKIKRIKRKDSFITESETNKEISFLDKLYNILFERKLTTEGIRQMCLLEGKKYSSILSSLNRLLRDKGENKTVKDFLRQEENKSFHNNIQAQIKSILPSF